MILHPTFALGGVQAGIVHWMKEGSKVTLCGVPVMESKVLEDRRPVSCGVCRSRKSQVLGGST